MSIWFTADTHFGHGNLVRRGLRKFHDLDDMDATILDNINAVVKPRDTLYHLGDFAFANPKQIAWYREMLACKNIVVIMGNHDPHFATGRPKPDFAALFTDVYEMLHLKIPLSNGASAPATLSHYAMLTWNKSHYGAWNLHGHSHGTMPVDPNALRLDVGVDTNDFKPYSVDQIAAIMATRTFKSVDHHGARDEY